MDEKGRLVDGDQLLAVIASSWKEEGRLAKPGVAVTVMSNLGLERYLTGLGIEVVRTPVGDRYVAEAMREHGFNLGGEQSGHIIMSDYATTGDGLVAALQLLAVVKKLERPVSEICHRFEPLPQVLKSVRTDGGRPLENGRVRKMIDDATGRLGTPRPPRRPRLRHRTGDPRHGRRRRPRHDRRNRRRAGLRADQGGVSGRLAAPPRTSVVSRGSSLRAELEASP